MVGICIGCGALEHFGSSPSQAAMLVRIVQRAELACEIGQSRGATVMISVARCQIVNRAASRFH